MQKMGEDVLTESQIFKMALGQKWLGGWDGLLGGEPWMLMQT
jgi:hypothetical protein